MKPGFYGSQNNNGYKKSTFRRPKVVLYALRSTFGHLEVAFLFSPKKFFQQIRWISDRRNNEQARDPSIPPTPTGDQPKRIRLHGIRHHIGHLKAWIRHRREFLDHQNSNEYRLININVLMAIIFSNIGSL